MEFIDLKGVLNQAVSPGYGDLVTRPTGRAVRFGLEEYLARLDDAQVAVIDFSGVRCLDYSCADEVVGKLLLDHGHARYFVLRGVSAGQRDAIEVVLDRYGIAVVAQDRSGEMRVLGPVSEAVRRAFALVAATGGCGVAEVASELEIPDETARETVNELVERRLAFEHPQDSGVVALA